MTTTVGETLAHPARTVAEESREGHGEAEHGHAGEGHGEGHGGAGGGAADKGPKAKHRDMVLILVGIVGLILTYIIYARSQSSASSTTPTATGTGTLVGSGSGSGGGGGGSGVQSVASALNSYEQAAAQQAAALQSEITKNQQAQQAANTAQTNALANLTGELTKLETGGMAPYQNVTPTSSAGSPPPLSQQLQNTLAANGETIVKAIADPTGGYLYLTNKGGVYTGGGAQFRGSYLGLTPAQRVQTGPAVDITANSQGDYTEIFGSGATYTF
jgi:hypothetical protein